MIEVRQITVGRGSGRSQTWALFADFRGPKNICDDLTVGLLGRLVEIDGQDIVVIGLMRVADVATLLGKR